MQTPLAHEAVGPPHLPEHLPSCGPQPDCPQEGESAVSTIVLEAFSESSLPLNISYYSLPEFQLSVGDPSYVGM